MKTLIIDFFLGFAALGIIISAIFGLRAVSRIFFGTASADFEEVASKKKSPIFLLKKSSPLD